MNPTWTEMRQAVEWSKSNYRHCGDYGSVRIGAQVYLDGLYIAVLEDRLEEIARIVANKGIAPEHRVALEQLLTIGKIALDIEDINVASNDGPE